MLTTRIALRYLFSKKSHHAVNIISAISVCGVAVATAAIVVVLSVFNGFTRLSQLQLSNVDADLKLTPLEGKFVTGVDSLVSAIASLDGVKSAAAVIEERAMLVGRHCQQPVVIKAVGDDYEQVVDLGAIIIDGVYTPSVDSCDAMQISVGVANRTGLRPSLTTAADLYVPRRQGRINPANPAASFRSAGLIVSGVFEADNPEADNDRVVVPLDVAQRLLDCDDAATAIEVSFADAASADAVTSAVIALCGRRFKIEDRYMQQEESYRMIEIEKWVTFMMLVFILVIASFNIISTMSLLVAEKRGDMSTLRALGASRQMVRRIFVAQGFLVTVIGGAAGIVVGIVLSLLQEHFGLIKLQGDPSALTIDAYPVAVEVVDILVVALAVLIVAAVTSQITRLFTKNIE